MNQLEVKQAIATAYFEEYGVAPPLDRIDMIYRNASLAVQDEYQQLILNKAKEIIEAESEQEN